MKSGLLQLSAHEHTGKFRPHRHTSYAGLVFALMLVGVLLLASSWAAQAAQPAVNPQTGSIGLSGVVPGPPPTVAATILAPRDGSRTVTTPITFSGTCPSNTFVTIEKNSVFGGITACADDGTYSLLVDLFNGRNDLVARISDDLGQFGPDSPAITIFYDAPNGGNISGSVGHQLFLETNTSVVGSDPNLTVPRQISIVGGVGPYAISWDWGDGKSDLASQAGEGPVNGSHVYTQAGDYEVTVRVTDSQGNTALLELVTVINGPTSTYGSTNGSGPGSVAGVLISSWPLFMFAVFMVIFFWLGERRELRKLHHRATPAV
jgi:hypothetical protein